MTSEQFASNLFQNVRERIQKEMRDTSLPSLAVAVAHNGEIIWQEAFGWADRAKRIPATEHTMYSLASISKPITTTGIMVLREQGNWTWIVLSMRIWARPG